MTVRKQVPVRVEPEVAARWSEVADARGIALNTFIVDATNAAADGSALASFSASSTASASTSTATWTGAATTGGLVTITTSAPDPLLAFDLAVSQTPALSGLRKWVDSVILRDEFAKLVKPE